MGRGGGKKIGLLSQHCYSPPILTNFSELFSWTNFHHFQSTLKYLRSKMLWILSFIIFMSFTERVRSEIAHMIMPVLSLGGILLRHVFYTISDHKYLGLHTGVADLNIILCWFVFLCCITSHPSTCGPWKSSINSHYWTFILCSAFGQC